MSPDWDIEDDKRLLPAGSSPPSAHYGSPKLDELRSDDIISEFDDEGSNKSVAIATAVDVVPAAPLSIHGAKQKSLADTLAKTTALKRASRLKMVNAQITAKNLRLSQTIKGKLEREALRQTRLERVELAHLAYERDEAMARQAHDLMMFEKQAQLEMIRAGHVLPVVDPSLF